MLAEQGSLLTRTKALQVHKLFFDDQLGKQTAGVPHYFANLQVLTACGSLEGTDRVLLAPRYSLIIYLGIFFFTVVAL